MSAAHRPWRRVQLHLPQYSGQGRLSLLSLSDWRPGLLGSLLEGGQGSMTTRTASQTNVSMTESDAIRYARQGDAEAFEYLYASHRKRVYSLCLRMLKNPADAEDLTQQAFLQVFRKINTFRGESGFSTWLHRVTVNVVLMHLRRKKPTEAHTEDLDGIATNTEASHELAVDDASLLGAIDRLTLRRALHKLP